ncbi:MAG: hypothetical protein HY953_01405, partial [Candidatus Rokubacteria bacterium]|nr:hypothetical protein [Candidatus Rokubacteria bacterium]
EASDPRSRGEGQAERPARPAGTKGLFDGTDYPPDYPCHNLIPCLIDVVQAGVTLGEAVGVMREAYGHAWDPAGQLPSLL